MDAGVRILFIAEAVRATPGKWGKTGGIRCVSVKWQLKRTLFKEPLRMKCLFRQPAGPDNNVLLRGQM